MVPLESTLTVLTVITIFALWPWDLNSIFLGKRVHKKNQFEKECLLNIGATEQKSKIQVYLDFIIIAIQQSLIFAAPTFLVFQLVLHPQLNVLKPQQYMYFHSMQYWHFSILKN